MECTLILKCLCLILCFYYYKYFFVLLNIILCFYILFYALVIINFVRPAGQLVSEPDFAVDANQRGPGSIPSRDMHLYDELFIFLGLGVY